MKLLLDAAFPKQSEDRGHSGVLLKRWAGGEETDVGLMRYAHDNGFDGVAFLGHDVLARPEVLSAAKIMGLALIVVVTEVPSRGIADLEFNLVGLSTHARAGHVVTVRARSVDGKPI